MGRLSTQAIMLVALVALAALVVFAGPAACNKIRSMTAQSRVNAAQGGAASASANDAVGTVARSGEATRASEDLTRTNEHDIRAAPGSGDKVNPAVGTAGIQALCKRKAYANDPRCAHP